VFAIGDHVQNASLAGGFPSALLIPPIPELLFSGLAPFDAQSTRANIHLSEWTDHERLHSSGDHLFVQLAPLTAEEYEVARWDGLRFFANALLASDEDLARGLDASTHIIDMSRASRCEFF